MTKTLTKQKQLITKKQKEFFEFVEKNVMPFFAEQNIKFDTINPTLFQNEWIGPEILITIPYREKMEPWFIRAINECLIDENKKIAIICGAKVNSNAWHKYVFPFAEEIAFVRNGKRPVAIVTYTYGCKVKAFHHRCNKTIANTVGWVKNDITYEIIENLMNEENDNDRDKNFI